MSGLRASVLTASAVVFLASTGACDSAPKDPPVDNRVLGKDHSKPIGTPSQAAGSQAAGSHGGGGVHGDDPHAGNPHDANMRVRAPKPLGPARDVDPSGDVVAVSTQELVFSVPAEWEAQPPGSRMRLAEYIVPGPGGDASLKLYRFEGGGGTAEANLARWIAQMTQPDGSDSKEKAVIDEAERGGLKFTRLDLEGNFAGQRMPGAPPVAPVDDARLLTLVVEGSNNPFFFKFVGPKKTIDLWGDAFTKMAESAALK